MNAGVRREARGTRRLRYLAGTVLVASLSITVAAGTAGASTTVHTSAELATAWANPSTSEIVLAADIAVCGTLTRTSTTAVAVFGTGHVLRERCTGSILSQTATGPVRVARTTLRDAIFSDAFEHGAAIEAPLAPVGLDHVIVTNDNSLNGAVQARSLVAVASTFDSNGVAAANLGFGGGGAVVVATDATLSGSRFTANAVYGDGAGIHAGGHVGAVDSVFDGNFGKGGGEAITAGSVDVSHSEFGFNGSYAANAGGAIGATGSVRVTDSTFTGNAGGLGDGGAIGGHEVVVVGSVFNGNRTDTGRGGAIIGFAVRVDRSTFHANTTGSDGGAIHVDGSLRVSNSTFDTNSTGGVGTFESNGGAIGSGPGASITIVNSTLTGNSAAENFEGSAIAAGGPVRLEFDTIADNPTRVFDTDPPVSQIFGAPGATLTARGSVVSGAGTGRNCSIATVSLGANYDDDGTCGFAAGGDTSRGAPPQLGPLADNGGPTLSRLPALTSPLVDAVVGPCPTTDERGTARPRGPACDIGSIER